MKPWRALQSNPVCRVFAVVGVTLVISSWGFVPHRHLHAKAWASLPPELRLALGNDPTPLVARATDADSRKHTDSLEAARHYFDLDDAHAKGLELWGNPWSGAQQLLQEADSSASVRRLGMLPWQLEWSYWRLVRAWAPSDSSDPDLNEIVRRQPIWAITSETRMFPFIRRATTTVNAPGSVASTPCGKPMP